MPDGAVVIADPNLIFHGEFKRTGVDLVLSHDGHEVVVHDYFRGDKRAAIASPDGAHLTGDIVGALTGYVQYAQAAPGAATAQVIGHVTKLTGSATAIRNGVSVILNNGDNVEKGDVVSTGSDSTLGVTFIDGTVFGLSSNARMVLNEMVYDPNGSNNSSLLSLVAGTITFVAGETAKHGDMKIDTPVATMGIRGTAVLTEINFVVPSGGGDPQPQANFQVLVEPNGTTGSYILFDKLTLLPIATVNQAGQMIQISGGNVSVTNALLSPDVQKLITDVFTLKFTDNNTNTKLTTNFTDTITQNGNIVFIKTDTGATATATFANTVNNGTGPGQGGTDKGADRFPGPPQARSLDANGNVTSSFKLTEHTNATADHLEATGDTVGPDILIFRINFVDENVGDRPTVSVNLADAPNYVYMDAGHHDVTASLGALQKQDIAATQIQINVAADGGNNNNGSAILTYTIPDHAFDFLAAGETLTLTYMVHVNDNFAVHPESTDIPITITITGTNDKPVITTSVPTITFSGGTSVPGGPLTSNVPTSGTLTFKDVDLTDTHTVSVALTSASLPDGTVPPGPLALFQSAMSAAIAKGSDSTDTGTGTINWSLADLPVYLADFIPKGEVLTLVYTVTVADEHGATSQQTITVRITGTDAPAVVWIATNKAGAPAGGFWKDAVNWETGTVPTIADDVIVITDQLHGLTPSYPVTINAAAYAKSITMNDFGGPPPVVINKSSLTVAGALNMSADSIFTNTATGTMSVGGKAEILDTAVLTNAGYLRLAGGGDFAGGTSITNSGTIELFGGTLKTLAEIHNAGGVLKVDGGATLIVGAATLDGGTVTILGTLELDGTSLIENGALNNSGTVNVKGAVEFANEIVLNGAGGTIEVFAHDALKIDLGSHVNNTGDVKVDSSGKLTINGATIDGGAITILPGTPEFGGGASNASSGFLIIPVPSIGTVTNNGELDLTGSGVLSNGILKNNNTLNVTGTDNALNGEAVTNAGTIEVLTGSLAIGPGSSVNNSSGNVIVDAALILHGATIDGGAIKGAGSIHVTGASKIDGNATLSTSAVIADAKLTLDGITVSGSVITDNSSIELDNTVKLQDGAKIQGGLVTNNGTLEIAGAATLLNDIVTNYGTVKVDDGKTLTLSGTEITGGTINNYSSASGGTIAITDDSTIDGHATLNKGGVTVANDVTLTLDDATVAGTAITNHGTVKVDDSKKLTLNGASLTGGTLAVSGTLASSGTTTITDTTISNSYLIESTLGGLLTLLATTPAAAISNGGIIRANGAELDINGEAVTNTETLAAINHGTLKLIATKVTNTGGAISIESGSTLDLSSAIVNGGTLTISGTLESTGTSAITEADITNTGTISVTSGKLTIDPAVIHMLTNGHLIEANGGELDITGEQIVNTADIKAIGGSILKLTSLSVTNDGGRFTVDGTSKLYLSDTAAINGGQLSNSGNLYSVSGSNSVTGAVTNTGAIEVQAGTLNLSGGLTGAGALVIDDGATLELGGADAQTVTFAGGTDTLKLDNTSHDFTGTIAGQSSSGGTFAITGNADITTSKGDALDFTASGGTSDSRANIVLTPTGTLSGANDGIVVTQDGIGDVSLTTVGDVTGAAGDGIVLHDGAAGAGNITATIGGGVSGAVGLDVVSHGNGAVTITNHGHIIGTTSFGIHVDQDDAGAAGSTHITNHGTVVGADGFAAISIQENGTRAAVIDNSGTIGPADAGAVTSTTHAIVEAGGDVTINNTGHINGNISVASATFDNENAGTWTVSGTSVFGTLSTIDNAGEIDLLNGASVSSADGLTFAITNSGKIESWGTNSIAGSITNTNTIEVHTDGTLSLFGSLSGSGSVKIDAGATLMVGAAVSQTVTFGGTGAELDIHTTDFGGSIAGLAATDKIDLSSIDYGLGTSAVYLANDDASTGGTLKITDAYGHHISLTLTGADYSDANFAGSDDGTGHTLITVNAADDAPKFTTAGATLTAGFSELADTTDASTTYDPAPAATGSIAFTDVDLTDRPVAKITHQDVTWLGSDHSTLTLTPDEIGALEQALSLQLTGKNNGTIGWSYSISDSALDFLGQDQTARVVSTITLDDGHKTDTTQVIVTITGANDAPTLAVVTAGSLVDTAATDIFSDLTGKLVGTDADSGETATLTYAVLDAHNNAVTTLAGHYGSLTVNSNGTYDYLPDATAINALPMGSYTDTFTVQTTDAHGATGTATLTVDVTGANDTPVITTGASDTDTVALTETNAALSKSGTLTVSDADTGDHVTVALDHVSIYLDGTLQTDGINGLSNADLLNYLTVQSGDILAGTATHARFSWDFNSGNQAFNFLAAGHTLSLQYTILPNDGHVTGTGDTVTVNIAGSNDAPTLSNVDAGTITDTVAADHFSALTGKLAGTDLDSGEAATLTYAVLDAHDDAVTTLGGQYGVLTVNADGNYGYVPNAAAIDALSAGSYSDTFTVQTRDVHGAVGTATLTVDVAGANDAPIFNINNLSVTQQSDERVIVHGLSVDDADAAQQETFTLAATTAASGTNVHPDSGTGSLAAINADLHDVTFNEGRGEPLTDTVTLTVTDGHSSSDTIHLIFNLAERAKDHVSLAGTTGKDVFFGTGYQDQFVFAANSNHDVIVNFAPGHDRIDLSAIVTTGNVSSWMAQHLTASSADTLITIDAADTILLKGVSVASLHAGDFIVHA